MAPTMDTYLLIRPLPGVGRLPREEVKAMAARSNEAVRACHAEERDAHIKWVTSYLTDDSSVCVYKASSPEVLKAHAERAGLPLGQVLRVDQIAQPGTVNETTAAEAAHLLAEHTYGTERPVTERQAAAQAAH